MNHCDHPKCPNYPLFDKLPICKDCKHNVKIDLTSGDLPDCFKDLFGKFDKKE